MGMALLAIILAPVSSGLISGLKAYQYNMSQGQNAMSTRELLNAISDELRYATAISVAAGTEVTVPSATITYTVSSQSRTMYATVGNPSSTYNFVIAYAGVPQKTISISNLKSVKFKQDATNKKLLDITAEQNNAAYADSPTMTTKTTLTMQNM